MFAFVVTNVRLPADSEVNVMVPLKPSMIRNKLYVTHRCQHQRSKKGDRADEKA